MPFHKPFTFSDKGKERLKALKEVTDDLIPKPSVSWPAGRKVTGWIAARLPTVTFEKKEDKS